MISAQLGDELEALVDSLVKTGRYGSKSEVLREGVRLVEEREARLALLHESLDAATKRSKAGIGRPAADVFADLEARYSSGI